MLDLVQGVMPELFNYKVLCDYFHKLLICFKFLTKHED